MRIVLFLMFFLLLVLPALAQNESSANPAARVYFANLRDGAIVSSPLTVVFGLSGMGIAPAGTKKAMTGHHHLLVDRPPFGHGDAGDEELSGGLPSDEHHRHFGGGQTEFELELAPGKHTLQLVLGDHEHVPHDPPIISELITIIVE